MTTTYHSKDEGLGYAQARFLQDEDGNRLKCSFDPENAKRYGIKVAASCGTLYALCPVCSTPWGKGWWILLNDARKCCSKRSIEQEEIDISEKEKERAVLLRASTLMKPYFAVVSKSKTKADAWIKFNDVDPTRVIFLDDEKSINRVKVNKHQFDIVFLGKRNNYLTHPALNNKFVLEELENQESIRDHQYIALYTDKGSSRSNPKTFVFPLRSRKDMTILLEKLLKENNKAKNPVMDISLRLFVRKGNLVGSEVYSPEGSE